MTKIKEEYEIIIGSEQELSSYLLKGQMYVFEEKLLKLMRDLYDGLVGYFLQKISKLVIFRQSLKQIAKSKGLKKLTKRPVSVQIASGSYVSYMGLYAEKVPKAYQGERSLSRLFFRTEKGSSLSYQSRVSQMSVITPSFDIAKQVLTTFNCSSHAERNRELSLALGQSALSNRVSNVLRQGENLAEKRVIIGIDGGRSRTRAWKEQRAEKKYREFDTPWKEPKMFVISSMDQEGKQDKQHLPVYDTVFGDDEMFDVLKQYLQQLQINSATCVQIVADGAPWIWNRAKQMLLDLGVEESCIIETLDFYHATEHLNDMEVYLPKATQKETMKVLKDHLWNGDIAKMKAVLQTQLLDWEANPLKPFDYFETNAKRMNYQAFEAQKLPVGSGIIESGIRRIINLRFKCPSSFWNIEHLEPLFFLRAAFLSGRWNILMEHLRQF